MARAKTLPVAMQPPAAPPAAVLPRHPGAGVRPALPYPAKRLALLGGVAVRTAQTGVDFARVMTLEADAGTWKELFDMQQAILRQLLQQSDNWQTGLAAWWQDCAQLKAANTLSKLAEQEFDLVGNFADLVNRQVTDWVGLIEGFQVGFAYWLSEKAAARDAHPVASA